MPITVVALACCSWIIKVVEEERHERLVRIEFGVAIDKGRRKPPPPCAASSRPEELADIGRIFSRFADRMPARPWASASAGFIAASGGVLPGATSVVARINVCAFEVVACSTMSTRNSGVKVRILLADDHDVVRRGLRDLLTQNRGWEVCGEATTGREAVDMTIKLRPNVVILDLTMPKLNGIEATRQIKKAVPTVQVLIFTMHESEQLIRESVAAGARGFLVKSDASINIISAVEALTQHRPFLTWKASEAMLESFLRSTTASGTRAMGDPLTVREREIVQLLAEGNSSKGVASILGITSRTVESHRATIMRKLDIHSVVQLVHYAFRNSILKP